jgi:hypothetical protein
LRCSKGKPTNLQLRHENDDPAMIYLINGAVPLAKDFSVKLP